MIFILMPIVFIVGIICIALEDKLHINKSAIALSMCVVLWGVLIVGFQADPGNSLFSDYLLHHKELASEGSLQQAQSYVSFSLNEHLGDVSGTLFFVLCSMLLVHTVDKYGGFKEITSYMATNDKRRLLWYIGLSSFFFSALLDNLAAAIVIISIIRKLVPHKTDRMKYACLAIIACNAGGSWSPIGDVTTLLLWLNGCISAPSQILHLFLPALVNLLVPLTICHFWLFKKGSTLREEADELKPNRLKIELPGRQRKIVFWIGILSLLLVPIYQIFLGIPAFLGAIIGLILLWIYTDRMHLGLKVENANDLKVVNLLHDADLSTIFYFLGVLMSVAALATGGQLALAAGYLDSAGAITSSLFVNSSFLAGIFGILSSLVDNVALVAATMGMYPLGYNATMVADGSFWMLLAYCAVTGGSLLIIGSATGVTIMGMEEIPFGYYFKRFSGLALLGYLAGGLVSMLLLL